MAKNGRAKWIIGISLIGLTLTALGLLAPWIYGAGKAQATLVAKDIALEATDEKIIEDLGELEEEVGILGEKFDSYHIKQETANKEIMDELKKK